VRFDDDGSEKCLQLIPLLMVIVLPKLISTETFIHLVMPCMELDLKIKI
jgi:hypothetical protein